MSPIDPTSRLGTEPLTPPPGISLDTPEQEEMYRATLEFERVFVQQMLKPLENAGSLLGEEDGGGAGTDGYRDMAQDQLTQAILDGGGLGFAATIYGQMAEAAGIATDGDATGATGAEAAPAAGTAAPAAAAPTASGGAS